MKNQTLVAEIREILPKESSGRYDLLPVFTEGKLFHNIVKHIAARFATEQIDLVAAPEALGFILGAAVAERLGVGFLGLRKAERLPYKKEALQIESYDTDYTKTEKTLGIYKKSDVAGKRILLIDEWIETGVTMQACKKLLETRGAKIIGIGTIGADLQTPQVKQWYEESYLYAIGTDI